MSHRVVITGMGWITPLGHDLDSVWKQLLAGGSGIARTTLFDADTFPTQISAEVKNFDLANHLPEHAEHAGAGRNTRFALAACNQAWTQANFNGELDKDRVGMYFASGEGSLDFGPY
ncbi:MAG: beta-ketoacyl synthase N-terminal-like domain-containing protein, partial [Planctomycetota bacterium]